ncbi:HAD-like domain-containing protein [Mycena rebaudengoi]|nr:HAD-like domain-containing protein [Mycena rebaudengoi]
MSTASLARRPRLRGLLIDISGTLHVGSTPTPDALDAFQRLQKAGIPYRLCSNTSKESTRAVVSRLKALGFLVRDVPPVGAPGDYPREIWTSIGAVKGVLENMALRRPYLLLSDSAREDLLLEPQHEHDEHTPFDSVVVGLCPARLDYAHLNTAFRILAREHPASTLQAPVLIAAHTSRFLESASGLALGPGPFVTALENAAGVTAHVVGKPSRAFFEASDTSESRSLTMAETGRIAIIGDDVAADLGGGAQELGLWRVLVRTGKYRPGDESQSHSRASDNNIPPDEVVDSFAAFVRSVLDSN